MDQNNHNNTIFRSTSILHPTNDQHTETSTPSSGTLPPSILRPHLHALPFSLIASPNGFPEFSASYPELEYRVPKGVFAESCPVCDEIAMEESIEKGFVARYPRGWVLVACKRHVDVLRTSEGGSHVVVGGQPELKSKAAFRFRERELKRRKKKAVEERAGTATSDAVADEIPETPPSTPPSGNTPIPQTKPASSTIPIPPTTQKVVADPCPICLSTPPTLHLPCTHAFCLPCLTHWQTTSVDVPLSTWLSSSPLLLTTYPILSATLKSRFTCPMCRANLQFTKQSRRKKKRWNGRERGEEAGVVAARSRRGGQRNRRRRGASGGGVLRSEWMPTDPCVVAPDSMPVVERP